MTGSPTGSPSPARPAPEASVRRGGKGNRDIALEPRPSQGTPVHFDFPQLQVGGADYPDGPTGCTVLYLPDGARTATDARGGAVGMSGGYEFNHAICFAGGSVHGLGAAVGVGDELLARCDNSTRWEDLPLVSGAVVYDLSVRDNAIVPDAALGRAALRNARTGVFPAGRCGAGSSATVGKVDAGRAEWAGQGAAYAEHAGVKLFVATVVNSVGVVLDRTGTIVRGNVADGVRTHPATDYTELIGTPDAAAVADRPGGNTTVTALVTNARLSDIELRQLATQVHSSMHRAIQPFHTESDGDVLFALTTDEVDLVGVGSTGLGVLASEVAWDAVVAGVR